MLDQRHKRFALKLGLKGVKDEIQRLNRYVAQLEEDDPWIEEFIDPQIENFRKMVDFLKSLNEAG